MPDCETRLTAAHCFQGGTPGKAARRETTVPPRGLEYAPKPRTAHSWTQRTARHTTNPRRRTRHTTEPRRPGSETRTSEQILQNEAKKEGGWLTDGGSAAARREPPEYRAAADRAPSQRPGGGR